MVQTTYLVPPTTALGAAAIPRLLRPSLLHCLRMLPSSGDLRTASRRSAAIVLGAELAALARRENFHHVHVHSCGDAASIAMFARLLGGPSYSLTLHGALDIYGPHQTDKWSNAAFAVVISQTLVEEVGRDLAGYLPARVEIAAMGVDLARFQRSAPYRPWDGCGPLRIFSCGRLNRFKGHAELVEAIALLRQRGLDARLTIAGEDDAGGVGYRQELEALIRRLELEPHVELLGAVPETRVRDGLIASDIFALASHQEGLSVATMEAMALGLPVIVTRIPGNTELVDDDVDGVLTPLRDHSALADRIEALARDPERAQRLGERASSKVERQFDSRRSAELIAELVATMRD
jgi:glycosyltransferase involved in cell wall biosynthesis